MNKLIVADDNQWKGCFQELIVYHVCEIFTNEELLRSIHRVENWMNLNTDKNVRQMYNCKSEVKLISDDAVYQ